MSKECQSEPWWPIRQGLRNLGHVDTTPSDACPTCNGEGRIRVPGESVNTMSGVRGPDPQAETDDVCPRCQGSGMS